MKRVCRPEPSHVRSFRQFPFKLLFLLEPLCLVIKSVQGASNQNLANTPNLPIIQSTPYANLNCGNAIGVEPLINLHATIDLGAFTR